MVQDVQPSDAGAYQCLGASQEKGATAHIFVPLGGESDIQKEVSLEAGT